ncbi:DUF4262 domain-containing protein [Rubrivivax gelatinosus]|uniref:DUF4262 domain-containing protein n=1 Tax=Rubrivivax gelatinosus TaxID=28068 RepID=UPI002174D633|nr:DUF4262 domain-containing protein [Rubrivivax gelatinosus]
MERGGDTKTRDDVAKHGCSVMHVFDSEGELPPFAYSIGIQQETGAPEVVVVVVLKQPIAHFVVNEYSKRVREGERFEVGCYYSGFLEGFDVYSDVVPESAYGDCFGQSIGFYGGREFAVVQIIYPTTGGVWPWTEGAPESLRQWQSLLAHNC